MFLCVSLGLNYFNVEALVRQKLVKVACICIEACNVT